MRQFMQNMVKTYKQMKKPEDNTNVKRFANLQYPFCQLGGEHEGEILSLICLEKDCQQENLLCCCICQEEFHKGHQVKPLKLLLREYEQIQREQLEVSLKQSEKEVLLKKITEQESKSLAQIKGFKQAIDEKLNKIQALQIEFYENLRKFVKLREISNGNANSIVDNIFMNQTNFQELKRHVKELLDGLVQQEIPDKDLTYDEITKIFDFHINDSREHLQFLEEQFKSNLEKQIVALQNKTKKQIFQKIYQFQFLPSNKHPQIEIVTPQVVKAQHSSHGYKFAVMTPALDKNSVTVFGFKLKNVNSSNWLAVGICDLQIVQNKQFGFAFQQIGHGGYMVSSNGGSWSNKTQAQNNIVKCFKFEKGDTIVCTYDPKNDSLTFQKNKSEETYKLNIQKSEQDLYPCVLFYYALDEVEFLTPEQIYSK